MTNQGTQSGRLLKVIRKVSSCAPVAAFVGTWEHSHAFRAETRLPLALVSFGLLPYPVEHSPQLVHSAPPAFCAATTSAP